MKQTAHIYLFSLLFLFCACNRENKTNPLQHDFIKVARTHGVFYIIVHFLLHRAVKPCQPICLVNKDACQRADDKDNDMFQR